MSKKRGKNKHHDEENGEAWLLPYSDLMTLLLAVFIVLFAVSKVDEVKAEKVAEAFRETMMTGSEGIFSGEGTSVIPLNPDKQKEEMSGHEKDSSNNTEGDTTQDDTTIKDTDTSQEESMSREELEKYLGKYEMDNLEELKSKLDTMIKNEDMTEDITTSIDARGLVINLNNTVLFASGSADIKKENKKMLIKTAKIINVLDNYIRIEGHTDNIPMNSTVYPSNWELSTARAASVVRLFINECSVSPEKVVAVGYGEYKPIADNSTAAGRAKNRRIQIIVLSEKYNNLEN